MTFGKECRNNVEYSEWSNELLFSVLDNQPELMLKTIEKGEKRFDMNEILEDLSTPSGDLTNIKDLIQKVNQIGINARLKNQIVENLRIADSKIN